MRNLISNVYMEGEPPNPPVPPTPPTSKTFTQEDVNRLLAENKRSLQTQNQKLITDLEALRQNSSLTQQERDGLQTRIEELQGQFQTKEQTLKNQFDSLQKKYDTDIQARANDAKTWQQRYSDAVIGAAITESAASNKAFSTSQIAAILRPSTKLVEDLGQDGKPTGGFTPRVDFEGRGQDGKPVKLNLTVAEAVKAMTEMTDTYGNLFRSEAAGGTGGTQTRTSNTGPLKKLDASVTMEEYIKNRAQYLQAAGN